MKKRDKKLLFYLIKDKIDSILKTAQDKSLIKSYLDVSRYMKLAETLKLDINELLDPSEYLKMKKYLFTKGFIVDGDERGE